MMGFVKSWEFNESYQNILQIDKLEFLVVGSTKYYLWEKTCTTYSQAQTDAKYGSGSILGFMELFQ